MNMSQHSESTSQTLSSKSGAAASAPQRVAWHALTADETLSRMNTRLEGLSAAEAERRLAQHGRNEIIRRKALPPWRMFLNQFANFFIIVLLFAAGLAYAVSYLPGENGRRLTAFFIVGIVLISVVLGFIEEYRAHKELEALDRMLVFKTVISRDGARRQVDAAEIVPGDILVLSQGQKVPADARVIQSNSLRTDESALTGESVGVDKSPAPAAADTPLAERTAMVYGSTYVTHGTGLAVAVSTGMNTEVGHIAASLQQMAERPTPFQVEVQKMARQMTVIVGTLAVLIAAILLFLLHEPPIDVALNTLSLAVATIPESLPIVLTFALALGARQMARRHAVVRRLSVVESLGSVDTICTDKTGTLTQNRMTLQRLYTGGRMIPAAEAHAGDGAAAAVLRAGVLCNEAIVDADAAEQIVGDPVDTAMLRAAQDAGLDVAGERAAAPRVHVTPFSAETRMMSTVHDGGGRRVAYAKGAPGVILDRCTSAADGAQTRPLDEAGRAAVRAAIGQLQASGMYVLGLAQREIDAAGAPHDGAASGMTFLGLQALIDPPKPDAAQTIARAAGAGIRVIMITGDNLLTAQAVADDLGLGKQAVEARELRGLSREQLLQRDRLQATVARLEKADRLQRALYAIAEQASAYALDPLLMAGLIRQESLFEPNAASGANAYGLMQVIPATGKEINAALHWPPNYSERDLTRPYVSVRFGAYYLSRQRQALGGDLYAMLAAYNGGPGMAARWKDRSGGDPDVFYITMPLDGAGYRETQLYIRTVTNNYAVYHRLYAGN